MVSKAGLARRRKRRVSAVVVLTVALTATAGFHDSSAAAATWPTPQEAAVALGRGFNLMTDLAAGQTGDEYVDIGTGADLAVAGGFRSVRLWVKIRQLAGPAPTYTINPGVLDKLRSYLDVLTARGLAVAVNYASPLESEEAFLALWAQLAPALADQPPTVYLELNNEPHWTDDNGPNYGPTNQLLAAEWNPLVAKVMPIVRSTNPDRIVIIAAPFLSLPQQVPNVALPAGDSHIIVTFHQYLPFQFTHQGASWVPGSDAWLGTTWGGTPQELTDLKSSMNDAVCWSRATGVPIWMGEFGTYFTGDQESRVRWTRAVVELAEAEQIPWSYFELSSDGFGFWNRHDNTWRQPLYDALTPTATISRWADCPTATQPTASTSSNPPASTPLTASAGVVPVLATPRFTG